MIRSIFSIILILFFIGCSQKEIVKHIEKYPHYDKDKANIYILNFHQKPTIEEAAIGTGIVPDFEYKIKQDNRVIVEALYCYGQYSYNSLDDGVYTIELQNVAFQLLGKRDDHLKYEKHFKKGKVYILKLVAQSDTKSDLKAMFPFGGLFSTGDKKLSLVDVEYEDGIEYLNIIYNIDKKELQRRVEDDLENKSCNKFFFY